jgi:hypothetical protein
MDLFTKESRIKPPPFLDTRNPKEDELWKLMLGAWTLVLLCIDELIIEEPKIKIWVKDFNHLLQMILRKPPISDYFTESWSILILNWYHNEMDRIIGEAVKLEKYETAANLEKFKVLWLNEDL